MVGFGIGLGIAGAYLFFVVLAYFWYMSLVEQMKLLYWNRSKCWDMAFTKFWTACAAVIWPISLWGFTAAMMGQGMRKITK